MGFAQVQSPPGVQLLGCVTTRTLFPGTDTIPIYGIICNACRMQCRLCGFSLECQVLSCTRKQLQTSAPIVFLDSLCRTKWPQSVYVLNLKFTSICTLLSFQVVRRSRSKRWRGYGKLRGCLLFIWFSTAKLESCTSS